MRRRRHAALACAGLLWLAAAGADEINEGELHFLSNPPAEPPHHHTRHILITHDSLRTGWVTSKQCHHNLDRVRAMEIVFGAGRVRNLRVLRADNIGRTWIEGDSVQMETIGANAVICLISENRALDYNPVLKTYTLASGPFMRRFLDGYFPIRVSLAIDYPTDALTLKELNPPELRLYATTPPGHVRIDTLFEGRLTVEAQLAPHGDDSGRRLPPLPFPDPLP